MDRVRRIVTRCAGSVGLLLVPTLLSLTAVDAGANPGFARKFGFSCAMCHDGFPKLNAFGETFARNGYQFPGGDVSAASESYGDSNLHLEKALNLAVRVDAFLRYRADGPVHSDIETPFLAKLFVTGYLAKNVTFYSYFLADEAGQVVGFEDAFLYLNNLLGQDLDLQIGQFQVMDSVYSREQRLTFQDIEIYLAHMGASVFELTYQRGFQAGYGIGPFDAVAGVVNGNGIGQSDAAGNFDDNTPKDIYGRLGAAAGPVTAGFFGYRGNEVETSSGRSNGLTRYGPDLRVRNAIPGLDLRAQWLVGRDQNPDFTAPTAGARISGGFAELTYRIGVDWTAVLLYNRVVTTAHPTGERNLATANVTHYFLRNLKGFLEYTHDLQRLAPAHPEKTDTAIAALVFAF